MFAAGKTAAVSGAGPDDKFNYVTMLLHGDGTNGAQNNTFLDSSTNNFTITRNGNTTQGSFSPYGSNWSNNFDGTGDYLTVPAGSAFAMSGLFTMELWFYPTAISNYVGLLCGSQSGAIWFYLDNSTSYIKFGYNGADEISTTSVPVLNQWNHIAVSRNGSNVTSVFLNGTRIGTATLSTSYASSSGTFEVGKVSSFTNANGYFSNARVVKGTAVYDPTQTTLTVPTAPLTAITNTSLLTCQSNRFLDASSNAFTVTVNGNPSVQRFNPFGASTAYSTSVIGGSGYFDGTGDYLSTPNSSSFAFGTGNFTVEFWYRGTDTGGGFGLTTGGSTGYWQLNLSGSTMYWQNDVGVSNLLSVSASPILNDAWNHVAVVRNSTTLTIYFNGVSVTSTSDSSNYSGTGGNFQLGLDSNVNYITGYIADYRIVKGTAVYTSAFTPPTAPLTAISGTSLLLSYINGAIFDNAMMNNLETAGNAQISTSVKKYGTGSMAFDGTGDWLTVPSNAMFNMGTGNFTIECWVYPQTQVQTYPAIFNLTGTADLSVAYNHGEGTANSFSMLLDATRTSASVTSSVNAWYHIALVRNGTTVTLYIDGTSRASATNSSTLGGTTCTIGVYGTAFSTTAFKGYIDDLRITKGYARYTATFTPPTSALSDTGPY